MSTLSRLAVYLGATLAVLFSAWPILIMVLESFSIDLSPFFSGKGIRFIGGVPYYSGGIFPTISNYADALNYAGFPRLMVNSLAIALGGISIALVAGVPAGYAMARMEARGKEAIGFMLLALRAVSPFAVVLPLYLLYVRTGLWDTHLGMSVAYLAIDIPVVVWMARGFFADVPRSIYEAAESSGANERQIFWRVALRLVVPGLVATAVFAFVLIWDEFLMASLLTGPVSQTVSVGIWTGAGESIGAFKTINWDEVNTFGTLAFVPAYFVVIAIRRYLARGFSLATAR
ncbi:MAG TPA: carbohydrate ABC transporter permease [Nitrososphaerales archaeon]|nr:carbohydrate ABC transporter permease [Nitrososphaerales archaeon]